MILSSKKEMNTVDIKALKEPFVGPVKAVILNHGDHAYLKVRFDE